MRKIILLLAISSAVFFSGCAEKQEETEQITDSEPAVTIPEEEMNEESVSDYISERAVYVTECEEENPDDSGLEISGKVLVRAHNPSGMVIIPDTVTRISDYAFSGCSDITEIVMTDSVSEIGIGAFENCTALTKIRLSDNVLDIKSELFSGCTSLSSVELAGRTTAIADNAFLDCISLEKIEVPDRARKIGRYAFSGSLLEKKAAEANQPVIINDILVNGDTCKGAVDIPHEVKVINDFAFSGNTLIGSVTVPDGVTEIGDGVFAECTNLSKINLPDSILSINRTAYQKTAWLKKLSLNGIPIIIGDRVVDGTHCKGSIEIPEGVTEISDFAFMNNYELTGINLPDSLRIIGEKAFYSCDRVKCITIPKNVEIIKTDSLIPFDTIYFHCGVVQIEFGAFYNVLANKKPKVYSYDNEIIKTLSGSFASSFNIIDEIPDYLHGDLNYDGKINSDDLDTLDSIIKNEAGYVEEADFDHNDVVDKKDYKILDKALNPVKFLNEIGK